MMNEEAEWQQQEEEEKEDLDDFEEPFMSRAQSL